MKIAIIGFGKMGKAIEQVALERGHEVPLKISRNNGEEFTFDNLKNCDVAIEFTSPDSGEENVMKCLDAGIPVISGTTAWSTANAEKVCLEKEGAMIHATNFSLGVNVFFELNSFLASMMKDRPEYEINLKEIHHTAKKDAPSGTAITLAEGILNNMDRKNSWILGEADDPSQLSISAERKDPAPGTHIIRYFCEMDEIEIVHTAKNRLGFALGALHAAEWIIGKKGVFTMKNVLFDFR